MTITSRAGLLGFLFSMAALTQPATAASSAPPAPADAAGSRISSLEGRLSRIAKAVRQRQAQLEEGDGGLAVGGDLRVAAFANGPRGGAVRGPVGGAFANGHPYYGGPSRGFVNGGGGFVNAAYRGGGFVNGGGGFVNARPGGAAFRNW